MGIGKTTESLMSEFEGILVDIKYLMKVSVAQNENEIVKLANEIMRYIGDDDNE